MNKRALLISLLFVVPYASAMDVGPSKKKALKKVSFKLEPEIRTFKKDPLETTNPAHIVDEKTKPNSKPSFRTRLGEGTLGIAMLWAGPYAIATAIKNPGNNLFFNIVSGGAFITGLAVTLAGFKKLESALFPKN